MSLHHLLNHHHFHMSVLLSSPATRGWRFLAYFFRHRSCEHMCFNVWSYARPWSFCLFSWISCGSNSLSGLIFLLWIWWLSHTDFLIWRNLPSFEHQLSNLGWGVKVRYPWKSRGRLCRWLLRSSFLRQLLRHLAWILEILQLFRCLVTWPLSTGCHVTNLYCCL